MAGVSFRNAARIYPGPPPVRAVDGLDLEVADGEFLVLVGPSGSGKSTALRMLAGLEAVDEGSIGIGDDDVTALAPKDRDIAMVFQNYALYPHMTVAQNMGFALKLQRIQKADIARRVGDAARMLDLTAYLDRRPKALSGGQRQRVAMGRAIVREPAVFLMDEPLSNLDAKLRVETRANLAALQQKLGTTTVYVTHDQVEAMTMGHRVAVLRDGRLQQCAAPRELYDRPGNAFVAGFIGSPAMNLWTLPLTGSGAILDGVVLPLPREIVQAVERRGLRELVVGVRPESLVLARHGEDAFGLRVELVEELGSETYVYGRVGAGEPATTPRTVLRVEQTVGVGNGDSIRVALRSPDEVHAFDPVSGGRLLP